MLGKRMLMALIVVMAIIAIVIGVVYKNTHKEKSFYGTVMEVHEGYILVVPLTTEDIYKDIKRLMIETDDMYFENDTILVYYEGKVDSKHPSNLDVTRLELVKFEVKDDEEDSKDNLNGDEQVIGDSNQSISSNNDKEQDNNVQNNSSQNTSSNNQGSNDVSSNINSNEEEVISYLNTELVNVSNYSKSSSFKDKAKNLFITVVDFLFYDGQIKGYTFSQLSDTAKLKVLNLAFNIDNKIEEKFPGYKDTLSSKYNSAKNKIVAKYLEITVNVCSNNQAYCDNAKEVWATIKDKASISWDIIKEYASKGATSLREWYEVFSGK